MCIVEGCNTQPSYNVEGESKAIYCNLHKLDNMTCVRSKRCIYPNCKTRPLYNIDGESKAIYCNLHKLDNMVDIISKRCIHLGCKTRPHYNIEGDLKAIYCNVHKLNNMINVISKRCIHPNCNTMPSYNIEGNSTAIYCNVHKLNNMICVRSKHCIHPNCKTQPMYNIEGESRAIYCNVHKLNNMIDVIHKRCNSSWCYTRAIDKYDGYCLFCYMHLFPDKPVARNYKTKEYSVVNYITTQFPIENWIADKQISGGCSKRRPDLMLDLLTKVVIIEVDENQHIDYDCSCENKRIMELSQDVGHRPIIFIRFNPDEYTSDGKTVTSCWSNNKRGICTIKKTKQQEWNDRLSALSQCVDYWLHPENIPDKTVEIIQLFYDK